MKVFLRNLAILTVLAFASHSGVLQFSFAAYAQTTSAVVNYVEWESVASRAEGVLEDRRASNVALGELRADVVIWRGQFLTAQTANKARITTLRSQLNALGPMPDDGTPEADEIADRRVQLNVQLSRLDAPQRKADEAYSRANGIVGEIDEIMRERQAERLTELGPSPLNPAHWPQAFREISQALRAVGGEVSSAWNSSARSRELREGLPVTLFYLAMAIVLLGRGRYWMERLTLRIQGQVHRHNRGTLAFLVSLGQVVLPVLGIAALVEALFSTKLLGFRGQVIADSLPVMGLSLFGARWLMIRLFPKSENRVALLGLEPAIRAKLRFNGTMLGLLFGAYGLVSRFTDYVDLSDTTRVVIVFPILLLTGVFLFRSGVILLRTIPAARFAETGETIPDLRPTLARLTGRALLVAGICGPLIAVVGYFVAANAFLFPTVQSLGLIGLLLVLQGVIRQIFALLTGASEDGGREALIPVLLGFTMMLASLPLFALIWGARVSDLSEIWTRFSEGVSIGNSKISPTDFLTFAVVFAIGYGLTRLLQGSLRTTILPKTKIDVGGRNAIVSGIGYLGIFLAGLISITTAGIDLSSLAIVAGALSVGIGFGLQNIVSNFVAGIILLIERPISEGDWIEVGDKSGVVREISVRSTRIETFDRRDVIVPNADLVSGMVTNWTRGNLLGRAIVPVGVAYGTDTKKVEAILLEIVEAHPLVALNPAPSVLFSGFGADSLDFEIRAILRDINFSLSVRSDIRHEIARRFAEEGIEIPFAQRDVWLKNPEVLQPQSVARKPRKKPA